MPSLVRFVHSCHIFMTSKTRGNILYTTGKHTIIKLFIYREWVNIGINKHDAAFFDIYDMSFTQPTPIDTVKKQQYVTQMDKKKLLEKIELEKIFYSLDGTETNIDIDVQQQLQFFYRKHTQELCANTVCTSYMGL